MLPSHPLGKNKTMWSDDLVGNNGLSSSSFSLSRLIYPMKTIEDVWKDVSFNNLKERPNKSRNEMEPEESCRRMLQEFLARPFAEHQQRLSEASDQLKEMYMSTFSGASHPRPATALSLSSSSDQFNYLGSFGLVPNIPPRPQPDLHCCSGGKSTLQPFMVPSPPTYTFGPIGSSFCKKRVPENLDTSDDRRHKRMIKNRESAARSRARKQAYTNELEQEVEHLIEENARLKKHHQKLLLAAASAPAPKKSKLQRSSTAPF